MNSAKVIIVEITYSDVWKACSLLGLMESKWTLICGQPTTTTKIDAKHSEICNDSGIFSSYFSIGQQKS